MVRQLLVLVTVVAVVTAKRSPHADLVDELQRSPDGSRYSDNIFQDARLDLESLIRKYQYPLEVHQVETDDGYLLSTHRIPHGRDNHNQPGARPVVLLMHGLLSSSSEYVVLGPGNALCYILAEEGYDVWMLNARGNTFSRNHTTLDPTRARSGGDPEFWQFSWDEIGRLDLPAYIDYILEVTGQTKVHYVGHSQGGTAFLVMASMRPEYNDKIISFQALAPAAYFYNNGNVLFGLLAPYDRVLQALADSLGIAEILRRSDTLRLATYLFCRDGSDLQSICLQLLENENNVGYVNSTMLPLFLGHAPAGASIRQYLHYAQCIKHKTFSRWHYGAIRNLQVYGTIIPPPYDMSRITTRSYLFYSFNDDATHWKDILHLSEQLPDARAIQVPRPSFTHYDYIWGIDVKEQVYDTLIEMLREAESLV